MIRTPMLVICGVLVTFSFCGSLFAQAPTPMPAPKVINGGVLNGKANELPMPDYPDSARSKNVGGTVAVNIVIDEGGNVVSAKAEPKTLEMNAKSESADGEQESQDNALLQSAENAAMRARFTPTRLNGVPMKVTGKILYKFSPEIGKVESPAQARMISGGVLNGRATSLPSPAYPPAAAAVRAEGSVTVQVVIGANGDVISASTVSGHPLLRAAAESAARGAKFAPTFLQGEPVLVSGVLTYDFALPRKDDQ